MAGCASCHGLLQVVDAIPEVLSSSGAHVSLPLPYAMQTRDTKWVTGSAVATWVPPIGHFYWDCQGSLCILYFLLFIKIEGKFASGHY